MGSPRHAAPVRPERDRRLDRLAVGLPAAVVVVAMVVALLVVVSQVTPSGGPAATAARTTADGSAGDGAGDPRAVSDPGGSPSPAALRTAALAAAEDAAVDAAIRAAVVEQERIQRMRDQAARKAARWNDRHHTRVSGRRAQPPAGSTGTAGSGVWIVGDSIASGIGAAWPGDPVVVAVPGAHSSTVVPRAAPALAAAPSDAVTVVALGTNDNPTQPEAFRSEVRTLLAAAPGCVVWTTIHQPGGRWEALNAVLESEAASSGGRLQLADWDRLASAHPDWLQSDGIHPRTGTVYSSIVALAQQAATRCR